MLCLAFPGAWLGAPLPLAAEGPSRSRLATHAASVTRRRFRGQVLLDEMGSGSRRHSPTALGEDRGQCAAVTDDATLRRLQELAEWVTM
jgi:hypothetical protein